MDVNRTRNTLRNSIAGIVGQVITVLLSIISRKVYIQYIGVNPGIAQRLHIRPGYTVLGRF